MTKELMNWNNIVGGKKAERIPCPDGIEGCLVAHYKVIQEQPKQEQVEPVGEVSDHDWSTGLLYRDLEPGTKLYTTPQTKEWVGLTTEEQSEIYNINYNKYAVHLDFADFLMIYTAIDAKLKNKNT